MLTRSISTGTVRRQGEVIGRVSVTVTADDRLGMTPRERRRSIGTRFDGAVDPILRDELAAVVRRRGAAARRAPNRLAPIEVVLDGGDRLTGRLQPPQHRHGALCDLEFNRARTVVVSNAHRLSRDEVAALKFAAHRQLARWAKNRPLRPRQQAQRNALVSAVRVLEHPAFGDGAELRVSDK
jgi:hypothetical protein